LINNAIFLDCALIQEVNQRGVQQELAVKAPKEKEGACSAQILRRVCLLP